MNQFALGAIKSSDDYRDGIAAASSFTPLVLPTIYKTDIVALGVLNQALIPACVSHAWVQIMKYWWYLKTGEIVEFSPRFLDILSWESDLSLNDGRRPRTVAQVSKDVGCCTVASLPNDTSLAIAQYRDKSIITQAMRDEAAKYKIPGYIDFTSFDINTLRSSIFQYGVVSILLNIGQEWWIPSWSASDIMPLKTPNPIVGGHQTVRNGWSNELAVGLNEWSINWGYSGSYTYNEANYQPFTHEVITIADLEEEVLTHLKSLPPPNTFKYTFNENMQYGDGQTTPNDEVKQLQIALSTLGYFKYPGITGFYGSISAKAVYDFQIANGVELSLFEKYIAKGWYFGPESREKMNQILNQ